MRRRTVTAVNEQGEYIRVSLGEPVWTGKEPASAGIWLTGLWIGRHRVVAEYDSIWESSRHPGRRVGKYYVVVTNLDEVIRLRGMTGIELPEFVPVKKCDDCLHRRKEV
jgi:hypothetical protein